MMWDVRRCLWWLITLLCTRVIQCQVLCPKFCSCTKVRARPIDLLKVKCEEFTSLHDLHLDVISLEIVHLDLSDNKLKAVNTDILQGLENLEKLDLSGNPLVCDCQLSWLLLWAVNTSVKLSPPARCGSPPPLRGQPLRKLQHSELHCDWPVSALLELIPNVNQVVFVGDELHLLCRASAAALSENTDPSVSWLWGSSDPTLYLQGVRVDNRFWADSGLVESVVSINHLLAEHSGLWNCHLTSREANHSQSILIMVLSQEMSHCPQTVTETNKGVYWWPRTVAGYTLQFPCQAESVSGLAHHTCDSEGKWERLDVSECPYISPTTSLLDHLVKMNLSLIKESVLETARRLKNLTANPTLIQDPVDVVFISKIAEKYLEFVDQDSELGSVLADIVSSTMSLPKRLLIAAQSLEQACSRLVKVVERLAQLTKALNVHKANLVIEEFRVKRESFSGITCTWYYRESAPKNSARVFHCSTSNTTALIGTKVIEASIQVPSSLFYQLQMQGAHTQSSQEILVSMYENSWLFPQTLHQEEMEITSIVVGTKLVNVNVSTLAHPVYVMLRAAKSSSPRPVWWDASLNNHTGGWSQAGCRLSHVLHGLLVFQCDRLGYFALMQDQQNKRTRVAGGISRWSHPAIYMGSLIGVFCLTICVLSYIICHASIQMSKKSKHCLANTWAAMALLCLVFSVGIRSTEDEWFCKGVGLLLHYLTLSSLLWMSVTANNMYHRASRPDGLDSVPEDDLPVEQPAKKSLFGLYLVGWGVGLIVCGISGAVNLPDYAGTELCFLPPGPALSAVVVPSALVLLYLVTMFLLARYSAVDNDGTQATEHVDFEQLDSTIPVVAERVSLHTQTASSEMEDPEHGPLIQLRAQAIVLVLFLFMWTFAAMAMLRPLRGQLPHEETIFSFMYAFLCAMLGSFVLFFYCVARSDVRSHWHTCRTRRTHCCRTRSISDTNQGPPGNRMVSACNSVTSRTPPCATAVKPVIENNDTGEQNVVSTNCKSSNVNLVMLNHQHYGLPAYTEPSGASGVEMFYNPHQSTVARKFFRKQRRHLGTRRRGDGGSNARAESAVFLSSDKESARNAVSDEGSAAKQVLPLERLVIGAECATALNPPCKTSINNVISAPKSHEHCDTQLNPNSSCLTNARDSVEQCDSSLALSNSRFSLPSLNSDNEQPEEQAMLGKKETSV
uniref:Adhesion G protein-coupled receptor A3 n=1 Tax=Timema cristinae TaxID=61476 RepID=A0A7R9CTP3_TIMCR|nr:unnamed protein product [Timema cristinae]